MKSIPLNLANSRKYEQDVPHIFTALINFSRYNFEAKVARVGPLVFVDQMFVGYFEIQKSSLAYINI